MVPWMHQSTLTCQMDCPASQLRQGSICFHSFAATLGAWIRSQWTLRMLCEDEHNKDQLHFFGRETLDFVVVFLCTANCVAKQMEHYEILYVLCPSAGKTWIHPFDCQNQNLLWLWRLSHCQSGGEGMKALFNIDWLFFFQCFGENGENGEKSESQTILHCFVDPAICEETSAKLNCNFRPYMANSQPSGLRFLWWWQCNMWTENYKVFSCTILMMQPCFAVVWSRPGFRNYPSWGRNWGKTATET